MKFAFHAILSIALLGGLMSCRDEQGDVDVDTSRPAAFGFQTSLHTSLMAEGKLAYQRYCAGCHGGEGDGNGDSAKFYDPKPRNFKLAYYKFSSTRSGQLPTDDDLRRTIREGLKGSAMPPFNLLPERTIEALIVYLKTFSPKWEERGTGTKIPFVEDPYSVLADKSSAIARGEGVYHGFATCWTCHPAYVSEDKINEHIIAFGGKARPGFRPGLQHGVGKENVEGQMLYPPDFIRDYVRSGAELEDIYRIIGAGITGTAMPTWVDSIDIPGENPGDAPLVQHSDLWAMAYYVQELIKQRPAKLVAGTFEIRERPKVIYLHGEPPKPAEAEHEDEGWGDEDEWEDDQDEEPDSEDEE